MEFKFKSFQMLLHFEPLEYTTIQPHFRGISYTFLKWFKLFKQIHINHVEFKCGFEFAFQMQYTPFKWNCLTHQKMYFKIQHSIMCLSIASILIVTSCFVCRVEVEPEPEAAPFVEDQELEPRQQGKQTPIDHVDKIPLPSHVSLMHCIG